MASVRVVVQDPLVLKDSTPGRDDGALIVQLRVENVSNAAAAVEGLTAMKQAWDLGGLLGILPFALQLFTAFKRRK